MSKPIRLIIVFLSLLLFAAASVLAAFHFFDSRQYGQVAGTSNTNIQPIIGVIVPHHDLAKSLIIEAVNNIRANHTPSTIVIFSPNHFAPESPLAVSGYQLKSFPLAQTVISSLADASQLTLNDELLANEHGLYIPMGYLYDAFPAARFVPIMISPLNYHEDQVNVLSAAIVNLVPSDTLFVISTDFAHNLQFQPALEHNQTSIDTIKDFNYPQLLKLNDNYLDAPVAMVVFLKIMQLKNATAWELWSSSHGALLTNTPTLQGTSYVTGAFRSL